MSLMSHLLTIMWKHLVTQRQTMSMTQQRLQWVSKNNSYCWVASSFNERKEILCKTWRHLHHLHFLGEDHIKPVDPCMTGYVCYQSFWNISSSLPNNMSAEPCKNDNTYCIKPGLDQICSNLTINFTQQCGPSPFSFPESIGVGMYYGVLLFFKLHDVDMTSCLVHVLFSCSADFLSPTDIRLTHPTRIPVQINTTLPQSCQNLSTDFICSGKWKYQKQRDQHYEFRWEQEDDV